MSTLDNYDNLGKEVHIMHIMHNWYILRIICLYSCICTVQYICKNVDIDAHVYIYLYAYTCNSVHIYICKDVHAYARMYINAIVLYALTLVTLTAGKQWLQCLADLDMEQATWKSQ